MNLTEERELAHRFRDQYGLVTRSQLMLGISSKALRQRLESGLWELLHFRVIRLATSPRAPEQQLLACCLAAGTAAVASHQSAGWLWGLNQVPQRHSVIVPRTTSARLKGADVHRPLEAPLHIVTLRRIPCTDPLRTLVDLAAIESSLRLEEMVDHLLATKLATTRAIKAELQRLSRRGRPGTRALEAALRWRDDDGPPHPSVLESRALRLLARAGIGPTRHGGARGPDGRYRVDILLEPHLAVEVDGYAYDHSPEQMTEDARRRNRLLVAGMTVLVYTWRDIVHDGYRVVNEIRQALASSGTMPTRSSGDC